MKATIRQLEHASLLASTGSFTRAAEQANLSQSAFSRSIDKLEAILGVRLFDRDGRSITPTIFGEALTRGAADVLERFDEIHRQINNLEGLTAGSFSVALGVYPAEIVGHRAVGLMAQHYPQVSVRAHVCNWQDVKRMVLAREVDLAYAVLQDARHDTRFAVEPVASHEMAIYVRAGHPLADLGRVTRENLDAYPLVSIRVPAELAPLIPGKAEIDARTGYLLPAIEIDDFTVARGIVATSDAIGITTPIQLEGELARGEFVLLRYTRPWIAPEFGFIYLRNRSLSPAAREFMRFIREAETAAVARNIQLLDHASESS